MELGFQILVILPQDIRYGERSQMRVTVDQLVAIWGGDGEGFMRWSVLVAQVAGRCIMYGQYLVSSVQKDSRVTNDTNYLGDESFQLSVLMVMLSGSGMTRERLKRLDFSSKIIPNATPSKTSRDVFPCLHCSPQGIKDNSIITPNSHQFEIFPSPILPFSHPHQFTLFLFCLRCLHKIAHFCSYSSYNFVVMQFLKKCCQCYCFSGAAYNVACCIDQWHSMQACGLAYLYCDGCYWSCCAPICIECKLGDKSKALDNCTKGCKYCLFSCLLSCVGCIDGCYNCIQVIKQACGEGIKGYADLTKNTQFVANKIKTALGLETGNEPLRSMGTFTP